MSFKSFSSTLPTAKQVPAAAAVKNAPVHDLPAAPADKAAAVPAGKA